MKDLVIVKREQALTTSLTVAEVFGKNHQHIMRDIRGLIEQIEDVSKSGQMFTESKYRDNYDRFQPMYLMNFDGFSLLAMGFTGKKALEFKLAYIDAFNRMHQILAERQTPEWQAAREQLKLATRKLTDTIRDVLIPLALEQGIAPEKTSNLYLNYNRLINKCAGIKSDSRSLVDSRQIYEVEKMSDISSRLIEKFSFEKIDFHDIYQKVKAHLIKYAELSMLS